MYDYPIDYTWTVEEMTTVIALYNAVEKAYEQGISKQEFLNAYNKWLLIVDSKSMQKQYDREFEKISSYSIYKVFKASKESDWIKL